MHYHAATLFDIKYLLTVMFVCNCKGVTDHDIHQAALNGASDLRTLRQCTGATGQCGKCAVHAREVLTDALKEVESYDAMNTNYA